MKKIWLAFLLLFSYQFFFGTFIYLFDIEQESVLTFNLSDLDEPKDDAKVLLLNDNEKALAVRLSMIKHSESSIKIAVHQFKDDATSNLITAALIERLEQGVTVDIIIDGVMNSSLQQDNYRLLVGHGATLKAYEPNVFLLPYKTQNRLHDKLMIFDEMTAIIGGRNIGDRYFTNGDIAVDDRDIFLIDETVVADMNRYFEELIDSDFAKDIQKKDVDIEILKTFNQKYRDYQETYSLENIYTDALMQAIPVDGLLFVHNPINRLKKEPLAMNTLLDLLLQEQTGIIQSPYIVLNDYLEEQFLDLDDVELTFITNTIETSPNLFASSGYIFERNNLAQEHQLYEIQSDRTRHSKTWLIGDEYVAMGSLNLDPRSASLSTESILIIKSIDIYQQLHDDITSELDISLQVNEDGNYITNKSSMMIEQKPLKVLLIKAMGVFTYLFHDLL